MRVRNNLSALAMMAVLFATVHPAFGVSKEMIQLQTQVQTLSDQVARLQQSMDERMGVLKNLVEQSTDSVNKELPGQLGQSGESGWQPRGGHRLWTWIAPEDQEKSYAPDNGTVRIDVHCLD